MLDSKLVRSSFTHIKHISHIFQLRTRWEALQNAAVVMKTQPRHRRCFFSKMDILRETCSKREKGKCKQNRKSVMCLLSVCSRLLEPLEIRKRGLQKVDDSSQLASFLPFAEGALPKRYLLPLPMSF